MGTRRPRKRRKRLGGRRRRLHGRLQGRRKRLHGRLRALRSWPKQVQRNRQNLHPKVNERSLETQQRKAMRNEGISSPKKEFDDLERQGRRLRLYLSANLAIVLPFPVSEIRQPGLTAYGVTMILQPLISFCKSSN